MITISNHTPKSIFLHFYVLDCDCTHIARCTKIIYNNLKSFLWQVFFYQLLPPIGHQLWPQIVLENSFGNVKMTMYCDIIV